MLSAHAARFPEVGRKLDYLLGLAKGPLHNIQRSTSMLGECSLVLVFHGVGVTAFHGNGDTACGQPTVVIGYEVSEQLHGEPARSFVLVSRREKRVCRRCGEAGVLTAPMPPWIIEKGLASDRVVMDTVVAKYCGPRLLYRQSAILERAAGLEISRATRDGWVRRGELLVPVTDAMRQELIEGLARGLTFKPKPTSLLPGVARRPDYRRLQNRTPDNNVRGPKKTRLRALNSAGVLCEARKEPGGRKGGSWGSSALPHGPAIRPWRAGGRAGVVAAPCQSALPLSCLPWAVGRADPQGLAMMS